MHIAIAFVLGVIAGGVVVFIYHAKEVAALKAAGAAIQGGLGQVAKKL